MYFVNLRLWGDITTTPMDTKNKMVGLLLGIIIGIAWLYTEPNADITNTMGKEFALTEPQQINYLELKDIKPITTLNEEIYALQQTKTKEIIVSTNNTFHFLSGNIPSIPAQITPTSFQAQRFNGKINFLYCGSKQTTNSEQAPGLYYYDATHEITETLLTRVPLHNIPRRKELRVVSWEEEAFPVENFNETNSRPIYSCGAVVPSLDGNRIYFSENSAYPTASLETAWMEDISIPPASFIWMYEKSSKTVQLIGRNFTSVSSILLEYNHNETSKSRRPHRDRESSLLLSESSIYQISRLYLREIEGKNRSEIVHSQLSGMSGTLERDSNRNIWVSVGPQRTSLLNYIFSSKRLIKKGVLRLPTDYYYDSLFEGNSTIVQISPDGQSILAYYSTPFSNKFSLFPLGNDELLIGESSAQNVTNIFSVFRKIR